VLSQGNVALVSLWTGVLSCIELDFEKDKEAKKRRASNVVVDENKEGRLVLRDNFNIK
jgi:DNA damage-binding protein 1